MVVFFYKGKHNIKVVEHINAGQSYNAKAEGKPLLYLFPALFLEKWQFSG